MLGWTRPKVERECVEVTFATRADLRRYLISDDADEPTDGRDPHSPVPIVEKKQPEETVQKNDTPDLPAITSQLSCDLSHRAPSLSAT